MRNIKSPISPLGSTMKAAASANQPTQVGSNPSYRVNKEAGNSASNNRRKLQASKDKTFDSPADRATIGMKSSSGDRYPAPTR